MSRAPRGRSMLRRQAPPFVGVALSFLLFLLLPGAAISAGIHADAVVEHSNTVRARLHRPMLLADAALTNAAQQRANELAAHAYFDHIRPDGAPFSTAVVDAQYPFERVAENLGIDYLTAAPLVDGWMRSTSHRQSLLDESYAHVGVGVATGIVNGIPTIVTVQLLGRTQAPELRGWIRLAAELPVS
ncbi:MAG: CAP domain-containing protein [bacterium]|nr:CAP domain-containing protein [bacterium]